MRRTLAATALAAALFTVAACGGDDSDEPGGSTTPTEAPSSAGGVSTADACGDAEAAVEPFVTDLQPLVEDLTNAMLSGDAAAQEEAVANLEQLIGGIAADLNAVASSADDQALAEALGTFASELENYGQSLQELDITDPSSVEAAMDTGALEAAGDAVDALCG